MADKNKDGRDDKTGKPVKKRTSYGFDRYNERTKPLGSNFLGSLFATSDDSGRTYRPTRGLSESSTNPFIRGGAQLTNFSTDAKRNLTNFGDSLWRSLSGRPMAPAEGGLGDSMFGSAPAAKKPKKPKKFTVGSDIASGITGVGNAALGGLNSVPQGLPAEQQQKSLADYLRAASELLGSSGGGGVNYDPQRSTARQRAAEVDARLEAMYRQLRGSIDADAPVLQKAYQTAIDSTAQNAATAQAQTQAASDNAQARNDQVLANLGIQQAAGNQIREGRDLGTQTAGNIAAQASKGQAAGDRLVSNRATALQHNTNIGNAAGLEGNSQRAANQAKLNALLAEIDLKEQQDNAALSENSFSKQLSLANSLLDFDRYNQEQRASQDQALAKLMNDRDIAAMKAQSNQVPDLRAMLKMMGVDETWLTKDPKAAASLISALTKTTFAQ